MGFKGYLQFAFYNITLTDLYSDGLFYKFKASALNERIIIAAQIKTYHQFQL